MGRKNISLPAQTQRVVRQRVRSGEFGSADQYLRHLVLRDEQRRRRRKTGRCC